MRLHCIRRICTAFLALTVLFTFVLRVCVGAQTEVHRSVKTDSMQIALTFDDGPHPYLTQEILDILAQYNVKATFFMVGENVINYPDAAKAVLAAGHEVGNHTFSHTHVKGLSEREVLDELGRCEDALEELCEYRPHLFRPPEGALNEYVEHCSDHFDYTLVLWSLDTRDWENKNAEQIADAVLSNVAPGDIILMHDYIGRQSKTPEALAKLLPMLIERGYELVTVSRLLGIA